MSDPNTSMESVQSLYNYIPNFIGIAGTLLGTILGWFLKFLQDRFGHLLIDCEKQEFTIDTQNQVTYISNLFICNHSLKPRYMYDIEIIIAKNYKIKKKKELISFVPKGGEEYTNFNNFENMPNISSLYLKFNEPININLFARISDDENIQLEEANQIYIRYKNENNKTKTKKLRDFSETNLKHNDEYLLLT